MSRKIGLLIISQLLCLSNLLGQSFSNFNADTVQFDDNCGGRLDTVDRSYLISTSMLPGAGFNSFFGIPTIMMMNEQGNFQTFGFNQLKANWKFSALPHIGFYYSFGSKGAQTIHTDYQQVFSKSTLLNISLDRNGSNGVIRNNAYSKSNLLVNLRKVDGKFRYVLQSRFAQQTNGLSGGFIEKPAQLSEYLFTPVLSENAQSISNIGQVNLTNRFMLNKDSTNVKHALISYHTFDVLHRRFNERGDLNSLYEFALDSIETRDQYQVNRLINGFGYGVLTRFFEASFLLIQKYNQLQNLGWFSNRNETAIRVNYEWRKGNFIFLHENEFVLLNNTAAFSINKDYNFAAGNDLPLGYSTINAAYKSLKLKTGLVAQLSHTQQDLDKGFMSTNTFVYSWNTIFNDPLSKTKKLDVKAYANYSVLPWLTIKASNHFISLQNPRFWNGNTWGGPLIFTQQTFNEAKLSLELSSKNLSLEPMVLHNAFSERMPRLVTGGQLSFTKRVFEAKKMNLLLATQVYYIGSYQLMNYDGRVDSWVSNANNPMSKARYFLNFIAGFEIDEFRFFAKLENIETLWNREAQPIALNYYNSPFLIRIGITWDFFN